MTPPRLFGTDGVRGKAGAPPLDTRTIRRLGSAIVRVLHNASGPQVLIGRDTRESGEWIERELALGARAAGARVASAGTISTPAIAFLTRERGFHLGVVISASHNPFDDNGIKVFSGRGEKFTEELEANVEAIVADPSWNEPDGEAPSVPSDDLADEYLRHVRSALPRVDGLGKRRIAVDCANGATTGLAPRLLKDCGLDVVVTGCEPDGRNINQGCGSTHPERLAALVIDRGCQLGVAFDGDGDRAIFVDHLGRVVDGDAVMFLCAKHMHAERRLRGNAVVATVMSNIGLAIALKALGVAIVRCPVGDKYVMEEMLRRDLSLGGEQSGHIIFAEYLFTGDGLITAMNVLRTMEATRRPLADLAAELETYPQILLNVPVRRKLELGDVPEIKATMDDVERRLADQGRLLVRYSGTEPLLRIMLEGQDQDEIRRWGEEIAEKVKEHLA